MPDQPLTTENYPLAETSPERVTGHRGKSLDELTLQAVLAGDVGMEDLRITPNALLQQAQIARSAGRAALARNFERAAEMTRVPQDTIMEIYELLRPGRTRSIDSLQDTAQRLRRDFDAPLLAQLVEEAASAYEKRGLFRNRY
ncbi:Propanediol dehydratase small subunit [Roseovarius sp. THAF8]|uniref:diol dehydratase small subunit n=1 Tax=Roseovarius sp. THAF8 TaxID=2587846 RepID=UPI0012685094|nr:diol dehydratase small subunit [Roseovarius sp. THAF8]QFT96925.1 Propanediol dehydratase small subunit [Roseovarius sp. THAF8]